MPEISFHRLAALGAGERAQLMQRAQADLSGIIDKVRAIIATVRTVGDAALLRYAREFDRAEIKGGLKVSPEEFDAAFKAVDPEVIEAIKYAIANIRSFHEEQRPPAMSFKEIRPGAFAGDRFAPIPSVALYVPRGKGAFPSVTMMTTGPAVIAGVPDISILTPPGPDGSIDAGTLVAARLSGVETVYKCGGAQAVAAIAYGTETIKRTVKIVGPGSPWVVAAKSLLADVIDTGLPAGPSESIILADDTVDGGLAALDLLVEAEHGPDSSAYLVTHSPEVAEAARAALPGHWSKMTPQRVEFSRAVLCGPRGGIVLTRSIAESYAFVNDYAPEHLELLSTRPFEHLGHITHAAEILMGPHTPVTIANFVLGPNCVLPTSGWARSFGPLSVADFVKRSSVGYVTAAAYPELAHHAKVLADYEGFSSHANAVSEMRDRYLGNA